MLLITGATGFLGHHMVPCLVAAGYNVRALVRSSSDVSFLRQLGVDLVYADDITDAQALALALRGCDQVVHAAGLFRFWGDYPTFWQTNVAGTAAILKAAVAANVKRFIYISTAVVIGKTPGTTIIDETTPCHPQEPYQQSKLEAEHLVLSHYHHQGLPVVILRPGAFYGPWGRYAFNRLFFEEPLRGWRIRINRGKHVTFPAYAPDVAESIVLALQKGRAGEIYNICSQSLAHNSVNDVVSDLAGIGHWRVNIPTPVVMMLARSWTILSRYTHREPFYPINMASYVFQDWRVNIEKARVELGFVPTPFREGAQQTLDWYWQQGILKRKS